VSFYSDKLNLTQQAISKDGSQEERTKKL